MKGKTEGQRTCRTYIYRVMGEELAKEECDQTGKILMQRGCVGGVVCANARLGHSKDARLYIYSQ